MKPTTSTTTTTRNKAGAANRAWLDNLVKRMEFGSATLRVRDGRIQSRPQPKERFSGKPRGRPPSAPRGLNGRYCPRRADAMGDFLGDVGALAGTWEVTVKISDRTPVHWEYEEPGLPQDSDKN